ncbi:MAG: hypothetical protein K2Q10_12865 [Rhodospirillales bacterium]|nr:hypothetical protein [Rhodospirillales bacterium]
MNRVGGPLIWMGLAPLGVQTWLWLEDGRWTAWTAMDVLLAMGGERPYIPQEWLRWLIEGLLSIELGPVMLLIGLALVVVPPLRRLVQGWQAEAVLRKGRHDAAQARRSLPCSHPAGAGLRRWLAR